MADTIVKKCDAGCEHEYQDKRYGRGRRVHNLGKDGTKASCTVCGNKK